MTSARYLQCSSPSTSGSSTDVSEDSTEIRVQTILGLEAITSTPSPSLNGNKRNKRKSSEPRKLKDGKVSSPEGVFKWVSNCSSLTETEDYKPVKQAKKDSSSSSTTTTTTPQLKRNKILNEKGHFILNLPFDIRNILGSSASSTLEGLNVEDEVREEDDEEEEAGSEEESPLTNRNYKMMSRERRIEANARERTRVHTISAAFENLRRAVPSYSCHQKLSKLAILRIACSYILALANLNDLDYSNSNSNSNNSKDTKVETFVVPSTFAQCVDLCTQTIQMEGKIKKRTVNCT